MTFFVVLPLMQVIVIDFFACAGDGAAFVGVDKGVGVGVMVGVVVGEGVGVEVGVGVGLVAAALFARAAFSSVEIVNSVFAKLKSEIFILRDPFSRVIVDFS